MLDPSSEGHEGGNGEVERAHSERKGLIMRLPVRHLFLDLEDTVITPVVEGWWKTEPINVAKVKGVIEAWRPSMIHLFSFAIHNDGEREKFRLGTRPMLEERFGITLATEWRVDEDIIRMCCAVTGLHPDAVDFQEMSNFWGKAGAFRLCMQHHFRNGPNHDQDTEVMLLDDAVFNETFSWPDKRIRGHIVNIDTPPKELLV